MRRDFAVKRQRQVDILLMAPERREAQERYRTMVPAADVFARLFSFCQCTRALPSRALRASAVIGMAVMVASRCPAQIDL